MTDTPFQYSLILVDGKPLNELPEDLYIPPDALEVFLEKFEGPLDLLLYLIRQHNIDILDIPVFRITQQYMAYIELMKTLHMDLAVEYLLMAAMLVEIKSRMLLPAKDYDDEVEEDDPRVELVRQLQEYERFKQVASELDSLPRLYRDNFNATAEIVMDKTASVPPLPSVELGTLLMAFKGVLKRVSEFSHHQIERDVLSVNERMTCILNGIKDSDEEFIAFHHFFNPEEGRAGVVITFLAILELTKERLVEMTQVEPFSELWLMAVKEK